MKKKTPKDIRYINCGFLPLFFGVTACPKAFDREMRRLGVADAQFITNDRSVAVKHGQTIELLHPRHGLTVVVTVDADVAASHDPIDAFGLAAHEAAHVWQIVSRHMGVEMHDGEVQAYAIQFFTQHIASVMADAIKKRVTKRGR